MRSGRESLVAFPPEIRNGMRASVGRDESLLGGKAAQRQQRQGNGNTQQLEPKRSRQTPQHETESDTNAVAGKTDYTVERRNELDEAS